MFTKLLFYYLNKSLNKYLEIVNACVTSVKIK